MEQEPTSLAVETRTAEGRFLPGVSGNPKGRPPALREQITDLQTKIEQAVRNKFPAERVIRVIEKTFAEAEGTGKQATQCRKLIFEYFMRKPTEAVQNDSTGNTVVVRIENATFKATHDPAVIDGEVIEVKENG